MKFRCGQAGSENRPFFLQAPVQEPKRLVFPHENVPPELPECVKQLYKDYGDEYEWYLDELTILSLKCVRERFQGRFLDFAFRYAGLGHVKVYFVDTTTCKVYARMDGGSNSYDRVANAQKHARYEPDEADRVDVNQLFQLEER